MLVLQYIILNIPNLYQAKCLLLKERNFILNYDKLFLIKYADTYLELIIT